MTSEVIGSLHYLFYPSSIAVIGASSTPGKWGFNVLNRLINSHTTVQVFPVHRSADKVQGLKAYHSLSEIPSPVDLAVVAVPPEDVPKVMKECADKGVKAAVIITAGFKETGPAGGELESEVLRIAKGGGVRIVGPNCIGYCNTDIGLFPMGDFTPGEFTITPGPIALISQSGNVGVHIIQQAVGRGAGFSKYISSGNEADFTTEDYLEYLSQDEQTKVISAYVEGIRDGRRFFSIAQRTSKHKPIVAIKVGRFSEAAKAALSHTGALSGSDSVYEAAFRQSGVIRVEETDDLIDVAMTLASQPLPRGRRVGIVTIGGGFGAIAADACRRYGLEVPPLSQETSEALNKYLPARWSHANPVDMAGSAEAGAYGCIGNLLKATYIDALLLIGAIGFPAELYGDLSGQDYARMIAEAELQHVDGLIQRIHQYQKPVLVTGILYLDKSPAVAKLKQNGIYMYRSPEAAVRVIAHLVKYAEYLGIAAPQKTAAIENTEL